MKYKTNSDITLVNNGVIAHGVNRQRVMGSGVAKAIYTKWPQVKESYMKEFPIPKLGSIRISYSDNNVTIYNCYTQENYGYDGKKYADINAIIDCLENVIKDTNDRKIHIPKIGCDRGGNNWNTLEVFLLKLEFEYNINFIVHML